MTNFMQTWKTTDIPDKWASSPESVAQLMPSARYVLMTDQDNRNFVKEHFPDFLSIYDAYPYNIQRADAIRYLWLYINGGVYMDLDIVLTKSLQPLIGSEEVYLLPSANNSYYYTNALMISPAAYSNFWLECIEEMKRAFISPSPYWVGKHLYVMNTTGPMMLTRVARKTERTLGILPSVLLAPCSVCDLPCVYDKDKVYAYAIEGSSWAGYDTLFYNSCLCHWDIYILIVVILLMLLAVWIYN